VYPNSGTFNGTATYPTRDWINQGFWDRFTWVGAADLNGDGLADVVAIDSNGAMYVAQHSGRYDGPNTLNPGLTVINTGWQINDLVFVYDYNGDGFDDILARRAGTGTTYVYFNNGGISGTGTLRAPVSIMSGGQGDSFEGIADVNMDGLPDFVYVSGGYMAMIALNGGSSGVLGYGWETIDRIVLTDVDNDGLTDILGRRAIDSTLLAYQHSGTWTPVNGTAYGTYRAPVVVGTNWWINDIIG
jgi:hypothetical protein